jgi:hypothetical protein
VSKQACIRKDKSESTAHAETKHENKKGLIFKTFSYSSVDLRDTKKLTAFKLFKCRKPFNQVLISRHK